MRDYDEISAFLGTWGPFQRVVFFSLALSIVPNGLVGMYIVFVADSPPHECLIPQEYNISEAWRNVAIPVVERDGTSKRSSCSRYRLDALSNYSRMNYTPNVEVNVSEIAEESCLNGWRYSTEIYKSTIVTEWDLVCEHEYKEPLTSSIYFLGVLVGTFISGQMSDRFGRRPVLFTMMVMQTVTIFIQIFSPNWEFFTAVFFFVGFGGFSNYVIAYVLGAELLSPSIRVVFGSLGVFMGSAVGSMILPFFAYFIRDWRWLLVPMAASSVLYIPLWWLIPESPRWLISQGRLEEAEAILRKAAKTNGVTAPEVIFSTAEIAEILSKKEKKYNIFDIVGKCNTFSMIVICSVLWMVITMSYYALILNTTNLHGEPYLNYLLSCLVEIPAYVIAMLLLRFCFRRFCQSSTLLLGGAIILLIQLVPTSLPGLATFMEMVGKFGITAAFCVVYAVTAELFPTVTRNMAMGTCSMAARIGSIVSPFIIYLGNYYRYIPYLFIGTLAVLSGILCLILPETFGKALPETIKEMQKIKGFFHEKKIKKSAAPRKREKGQVLKEVKL